MRTLKGGADSRAKSTITQAITLASMVLVSTVGVTATTVATAKPAGAVTPLSHQWTFDHDAVNDSSAPTIGDLDGDEID